jgi:F-type H+-transporting ATPase subunit b
MLDFGVTFFITIVNILVLFFVLRALLFKPVSKFLADRAQKIKDDIAQAEKNKSDSKLLLESYEKKLEAAEAEADNIIKVARDHAADDAEQIVAEGKAEAARILASARAQAESERQAALAVFKAQAATLVVAAAGKLLRRELQGEEQLRYAREALEEMGGDS